MFLFKGVVPPKGPLAQWTERLVTSREVVGSSPARPTGSMVCFRAVIVRYLLWRMLRRGRVLSACARVAACDIVFL